MNKLKELVAELEPHLFGVHLQGEPAQLYDPMEYLMRLGGKRIRPAVVLAVYRLYHDHISDEVKDLAMAVEMFHNFTLMHDDIMDNALLRRGKETVHEKWDVPTAILSGDLMLIKVYEVLCELQNPRIMKAFNQMATALCEGQMMDMQFEELHVVEDPQFLLMVEKKTAVLLAFALQAGGILAGAPEADIERLYKMGIDLGIGFQLIDDYLDSFGDEERTGKKVGGDILEQKRTYLWNYMFRQLDEEGQQRVIQARTSMNEDEYIAMVKSEMVEHQADQFTRQLAIKHHNKAMEYIDELHGNFTDDSRGDSSYLIDILHILFARQF